MTVKAIDVRVARKTPGSTEPLEVKTAVKQVAETERALADGFVTRAELEKVKALSSAVDQPFASQFTREFAELAEARFSAATPQVKSFSERLMRLFRDPDPVTRVPGSGIAEAALRQLWATEGTGGATEVAELQRRFEAGGTSVMEAIIEATGLDRASRERALVFLASQVGSEAQVPALVTVAQLTRPESLRDFAVALAGNPAVSVATVLSAAEPLKVRNARSAELVPTVTRLRADVIHALLAKHPDAATARELVSQLEFVSYQGADPKRDVVPLAEALLRNGAPLSEIIKRFPEAIDDFNSFFTSPRAMGELIARHAGAATGSDADKVAASLQFFSDFPLEQQIIAAMSTGRASVQQVLAAIDASGMQRVDDRIYYQKRNPEFVGDKVRMAMRLYERSSNAPGDLTNIHKFVVRSGTSKDVVASLETLIDKRALGKDELLRLIDGVRDAGEARALMQRLDAAHPG